MSRAAAEVEAVLAEQRRALLAGDVGALDGMADRLERAMRRLEADPPAAPRLAGLAAAAADNARLVLAAREGLARIPATRAAGPLTTYDARGRRDAGPADGRLLARR